MKLHLGSGPTRIEGFLNVDFDPLCKPDYCFNLEKDVWPFPDSSVERVVAHHVMEHLGDGYFHFLKELYRVCKDKALIDIRVPHFRHDHFFNDPTHKRAITPDGLRLFGKAYNDMCEQQGTRHSRLGYFYDVDFEVTHAENVYNSNYKDVISKMSLEEGDRFIAERNNVILEFWILLKAHKQTG